ncbi:flavin reductase family protein [Ornithinimicrobium faecis]|uniref:flavin reductase family protein n=1 Tax=Ornithinimicrobium faecis TaxID=2934158 RepID=UPI002117B5FD|nr:flavin reductase family protein [Ornithinimicrobium sp. HY1745]
MPVATDFRAAMAQTPSAVSVVTTVANDVPYGTTVSDFISLSMDPPMMLVSLDNDSTLLSKLSIGCTFGVNVLAADQGQLATHFASKRPDKFADVPWTLVDGAPNLPGRHAWITLTATTRIPASDHTLVLGNVATARPSANTRPLTYCQHTFGTHTIGR